MHTRHDISGTAFVINVSRARREDISHDGYAKLWVTPKAEALWDELAREVYPYDDVSSSLRNRFYLEHLRTFVAERKNPVCINLAAGFSDYPYLVASNCRSIEIDYPHIEAYKQEKIAAWEAEGKLPPRNVTYFGADLANPEDIQAIARALPGWLEGDPAFVIMEGITYYLSRSILDAIFSMFAAHLPAGSLVAFEHWPSDAAAYPVFARLEVYLKTRFAWKITAYNLFDRSYIKSIPGFEIVENTDIAGLERQWSDSRVLQDKSGRLPIFFTVLRKV